MEMSTDIVSCKLYATNILLDSDVFEPAINVCNTQVEGGGERVNEQASAPQRMNPMQRSNDDVIAHFFLLLVVFITAQQNDPHCRIHLFVACRCLKAAQF